jgi:cytochrome c oxidase subunit 1
MAIGVPSAIKTFNWLGTLWGGKIQFTCAMLFALGFVSCSSPAELSGIFLAQPALDLYLHDTYFVVAHFHMIMGVAGDLRHVRRHLLYWFPKMFGTHDERNSGGKSISMARSSACTASSCPCTSWDWRAIRGATPISPA